MKEFDGVFYIATDAFKASVKLGFVEPLSGEWSFSHDGYHRFCIVHAEQKLVGWIFGTPVDLANQSIVEANLSLRCKADSESVWREIRERLAGSWVFILKTDTGLELRQDACGTIGLIYDPEKQAVASHAFILLGDTYEERLDESVRKRHELTSGGWITGGKTAHSGIERLLPNHRLTLPDCNVSRIDLQFPDYNINTVPIIRDMASEIRITVQALSKARGVKCTLTGGEDARAILASMRSIVSDFEFFTFAYPGSGLDVELAQRLAALSGIEHTVLAAQKGGDPNLWQFGAGHTMAGNFVLYPTLSQLAGSYLIGGHAGEVGRAFLWNDATQSDTQLTARELIKRLKFPQSDELSDIFGKWLENLPGDLDAFQILDLAYLELRVSCWAFAKPSMAPSPIRISPFISYNQFRRMWEIPPELRASKGVSRLIIEQEWPELLQIPVNQSGKPVKDFITLLRRALKRPDLVRRKVRQLLPLGFRRSALVD